MNGQIGACTRMMCIRQGTPFCSAYSDGRACTLTPDGTTACTGGGGTGGGAAEGGRCSTSPMRGNPNGTPCAAGLTCQITDPGMPAVDRPNSGVCTSPSHPIMIDPMPMHPTDPVHIMPARPVGSDFCAASGRQQCRMLCPAPVCPAGQCAMRTGSCCDFSCQDSADAVTTVHATTVTATSGACATALASSRPMPGAMIPQCDEQGDYMPVQCHGSIGTCWCASLDGTEIPGTRVSARSGQVLDVSTCAQAS